MKRCIIIVAGGVGKRMGTDTPKQFLEIAGKPLIFHTIQKFIDFDSNIKIVLVIPEEHLKIWETLKSKNNFSYPHSTVFGGVERFYSVKNAIDILTDEDMIVGIHDAVRPLVSEQTIKNCFETAELKGTAIPVMNTRESLREINKSKSTAVDRSKFVIVQTPQCFKLSIIKAAYNQSFIPVFTDDASVVEGNGGEINLVDGNVENIKITVAADLLFAEACLKNS